jgi:hypothetical protein
MYIPFEQLPGQARIWVYQADRKLNAHELKTVKDQLLQFCENWNTHGAGMPTSFDIRFDQVIILAVDESQLGTSGCSIDSSVRILKSLEQQLKLNLLDQGKVSHLLTDHDIEVSPLLAVKSKVTAGEINPSSTVLNPIVSKKADLDNNWLIPAKESWLNKYFAN